VETASRLKDEFLASVSHELRNPLAPILTWTQLLRSGTLDKAKSRRALEVIERNVMSQAQLIDDLVDVSRVVSGKFRLDVRPIDLVPVIKAAADAQGPASDAKQIRLQLVLDERAGQISGDSERLQQVMWNLISNAIKFTPKGGRVQVVLQRAESHVEIAVSDSGAARFQFLFRAVPAGHGRIDDVWQPGFWGCRSLPYRGIARRRDHRIQRRPGQRLEVHRQVSVAGDGASK
jgi:signal transduction histidine kinase